MSSNENTQNSAYSNQTWNHSSDGKDGTPRAPNPATESRVLSLLRKNEKESQSQPKHDFSNPPPTGTQSSQPNSTQQSHGHLTLPQVPSVLSAEAQEFVPRAKPTVYEPNDYSQYAIDDARSLSVTAAEFVPRSGDEFGSFSNQYYQNVPYDGYDANQSYLLNDFNSMSLQDPGYSSYNVPAESTGSPILDRFNNALYVLNMHPGNMEEYLRPICEMIQKNSNTTELVNDMIVNDIVENLFEQSIVEPNFRYTGARICQFLNSNLKSNPTFDGFNKIFIKRCQKEYTNRDQLKNGSVEDQNRLRGLAVFMAEIFLNVEAEKEDGTVERLRFLPKILVEFVETLLSKPTELDVKCACQLLKLSGGLIEDIVKNTPDDCMKFEETISKLKHLQSSSDLSENAKFLVGSVIKLKENDWNRSTSSPPKKSMFSFASDANNFQAPEPVFYNQMGAPCSRTEAGLPEDGALGEDGAYVLNDEEEAAFLEWQAEREAQTGDPGAWSFNDTGYESYQFEEGGDEGGMGDEVEAAYEEFLQEQKFIQNYQPPQTAPLGPPPMQMPAPMHQMYNQPPPQIPPEYYSYQQPPPGPHGQQNMMPPAMPQNQMPQQHPNQHQHHPQQQQPHHQSQHQYNDQYHYRR